MKKYIFILAALAIAFMFISSCASSGAANIPTTPSSESSSSASESTTSSTAATTSSSASNTSSSSTTSTASTSGTTSSTSSSSGLPTTSSSAYTSSAFSGQYNSGAVDEVDASDGNITDSAYATVREHVAAGRIKDNHGQYNKYYKRYKDSKFWMFKYQNGKWKDSRAL